jgi:hypothetical protein
MCILLNACFSVLRLKKFGEPIRTINRDELHVLKCSRGFLYGAQIHVPNSQMCLEGRAQNTQEERRRFLGSVIRC